MSDSEFSGSTLKDLVCGMEVDPGSPFRATYGGKDYFFCSRHCLYEFKENPQRYLAPPLLMDPVCGMSVPPGSEVRTSYKGQEYLFCSRRCLAEFRENPERFIAAPAEYFTCPRHSGVRRVEPGICPQCGIPLEAVRPKWICPYHPLLLHDEPGVCPIYGMPLIPEPPGRFYKCDLHPKVKQLEPGNCPHCRMTLRPAWAQVCPLHLDEVSLTTRNCPRCGMKMRTKKVSKEKAKEDEGICPKCGLLFTHD